MHAKGAEGPIRTPGPIAPVHAPGNGIPFGRNSLDYLEEGDQRSHECCAPRFASRDGGRAGGARVDDRRRASATSAAGATSADAATLRRSPKRRTACSLRRPSPRRSIDARPPRPDPPTAPIAGTVQFVGTPVVYGPRLARRCHRHGRPERRRRQRHAQDHGSTAATSSTSRSRSVTGLKIKASSARRSAPSRRSSTSSDANALAACFLGSTAPRPAPCPRRSASAPCRRRVTIAVSSSASSPTRPAPPPAQARLRRRRERHRDRSRASWSVVSRPCTISATTVVHPANEAVSQANVPAAAGVPVRPGVVGTVTDSVRQDVWTGSGLPAGGAGALTTAPANVFPGEQQRHRSTYVYERSRSPGLPRQGHRAHLHH